MCGRFTKMFTWREIYELLRGDWQRLPPDEASYNVAPTQAVPTIWREDGCWRVGDATWGFRPAWFSMPNSPINARAETIDTHKVFREAFTRPGGRCLVPASGYYVWQPISGSPQKQPWYITRNAGAPILFAGLRDNDTVAIVTTAAHRSIRTICDRMPVMLDTGAATLWACQGEDDIDDFTWPTFTGTLSAHRVGMAVGKPQNNDASLIVPVA